MIHFKKNVLCRVGALLCLASLVQAAPFAKTIRFLQPDGTAVELRGEGDEFQAVFETPAGYTVTFDPARKAYFYATVSADGAQLVATDLEVGKGDPQALGLNPHARISAEARSQQARARFAQWDQSMGVSKSWTELKTARRRAEALLADGPIAMSPPSFTTTAIKKGLCLLIDFEDDQATIPQADIDDFCNGDNYFGYGNNGSVKQYFLDNSNNLLVYSNTVTAYIRIPNSVHPKSFYNDTSKDAGGQARMMIQDAIAIMRALPNYESEILPTFDDLTVDGSGNITACNVYYAGGNGGVWAMGLWPHSSAMAPTELSEGGKKISKYQVTNIGGTLELGTFCHENGHMLCGYPDIYDYDYDSVGGAGGFCLMNSGGHGHNPVQICAYLKRASGWATTVDVTYKSNIEAVSVSTLGEEGFNRFYRYAKPGTATEYFLFENRQQTDRDANIAASGIAIWHIDELGDKDNQSLVNNTTHKNYECSLEQADNQWHFQKNANSGDANDLYYMGNTAPAYSGSFTDATSPGARWWDGTTSKMEVRDFSASGPVMTFNIVPRPPVMLTTGALPAGRVGTGYQYTLGAAGGVTPYLWQFVDGTLPAGITLSSDGLVSGMPEEAVTTSFSAAVLGDNAVASTNQFSLTILPVFGAPFTETFESGGSMPDGWSQEFVTNHTAWIVSGGSPKGHPPAAHGGSYNGSMTVTTKTKDITRLVSPRIDFGPAPRAGQLTFWHYMEKFVDGQDELRIYYKTGVDQPWILLQTYTASINQWRKQTVDLPEPCQTYYIAFEGTAKYGYGIYIDDVYVCDPVPPLGITTPSPLAEAVIDIPYTQALTAVGGTLPYTFTLASGALPPGMTLSADGVISGSAPDVGSSAFEVTVTDAGSLTATAAMSLSVTLPKVALFEETFEHGGQMPFGWTQEYVTNTVSWRFQSGGGDGNDFNTPPTAHAGAFNAVLWTGPSYADHKTRLVTPAINLGAAPASVRLTFWHCMAADRTVQDELRVYYKTSAAGAWNLLATYTQDVPAWTQRSLEIPEPTSTYYLAFEGNAKFAQGVCIDDVKITDEASAPIITTTTPLPNGFVNVPYSQALAALGGIAPYSWAVVSNTLPAGLALSDAGVISGTPSNTVLATFVVRVTGADGYASENLFRLQVKQLPGFPFTETFETNGMPVGWSSQTVSGSATWSFRSGSPRGTPAAAHGGLTNACLYYQGSSYNITKLVSPMLNLGVGTPNTQLSFWMCNASEYVYLDQLRVYYKASAGADWTQLGTAFTKEIKAWTNIVMALPNPSPTYYIAFEGWAKSGQGVCLDDVMITGDFASPYDAWKSEHFTETEVAEGLITGDEDDPDGDGVVNALEYAMGLDPRVAGTEGLPYGGVSAGYLTLTHRENKAATDVRFEVEACTSLVANDWSTNGVSTVAREDSNTWWNVTSRHDVPVTNAPQRFLRLKVWMP